ncbi:hypothetical protein NY486_05140, partial [Enterobacter hormaechei]|nr:hypothetical protein [Enterobacter hormaechei]
GLDEVPPETLNIWEEDDLHKWRVEVIRRSFCSTWGSCAHSRRPDDWYTPKEGKEEEEEQLG